MLVAYRPEPGNRNPRRSTSLDPALANRVVRLEAPDELDGDWDGPVYVRLSTESKQLQPSDRSPFVQDDGMQRPGWLCQRVFLRPGQRDSDLTPALSRSAGVDFWIPYWRLTQPHRDLSDELVERPLLTVFRFVRFSTYYVSSPGDDTKLLRRTSDVHLCGQVLSYQRASTAVLVDDVDIVIEPGSQYICIVAVRANARVDTRSNMVVAIPLADVLKQSISHHEFILGYGHGHSTSMTLPPFRPLWSAFSSANPHDDDRARAHLAQHFRLAVDGALLVDMSNVPVRYVLPSGNIHTVVPVTYARAAIALPSPASEADEDDASISPAPVAPGRLLSRDDVLLTTADTLPLLRVDQASAPARPGPGPLAEPVGMAPAAPSAITTQPATVENLLAVLVEGQRRTDARHDVLATTRTWAPATRPATTAVMLIATTEVAVTLIQVVNASATDPVTDRDHLHPGCPMQAALVVLVTVVAAGDVAPNQAAVVPENGHENRRALPLHAHWEARLSPVGRVPAPVPVPTRAHARRFIVAVTVLDRATDRHSAILRPETTAFDFQRQRSVYIMMPASHPGEQSRHEYPVTKVTIKMLFGINFHSRPLDHFLAPFSSGFRLTRVIQHDGTQWGGTESAPKLTIEKPEHLVRALRIVQDAATAWYPEGLVRVFRAVHGHASHHLHDRVPEQAVVPFCNFYHAVFVAVFNNLHDGVEFRELESRIHRILRRDSDEYQHQVERAFNNFVLDMVLHRSPEKLPHGPGPATRGRPRDGHGKPPGAASKPTTIPPSVRRHVLGLQHPRVCPIAQRRAPVGTEPARSAQE